MDLSISIVSWNTRDLLDQCLASIRENSEGIRVETFVVDNHSADGSAEMVRRKHPDVTLIANEDNRGFAAANNQAFEKARGRYLLMLNPDTVVRPDALKNMIRFMDEHPESGAVGCRLVNPDGTDQHSVRGFPSFMAALYQFTLLRYAGVGRRRYKAYRNKGFDFAKEQEIESPMGAAILFRREALDKVGLLDPAFHMYYEEVDICRRVREAGYKIHYVPDAVIVHHGGQSARQDRVRLSSVRVASMMTYFRKQEGAGRTLAFSLVFYPMLFLRLLIEAPADLVSAVLYTTVKKNPYKARRCVDSLRGKGRLLLGSSDAQAILLLFLFALSVRLTTSLLTVCVTRDARTFLAVARHIQDRGIASAIESRQHPLFPILLAGFQVLFGRSVFGAQVLCSLLSALTVAPLFCLVRDVFGRPVGFLAGMIFAVQSVVVCNAVDVLSEPTFLLFYVTSLWLGLRALKSGSIGCFAGAGFVSGLAYLARPEGLLAAMTVAAWVPLLAVVRIRRGGIGLVAGLLAMAVGVGVFALPYSKAIGWRVTPKKKVTELVTFEENPPRFPDEEIPEKPADEKARYLAARLADWWDVFLKTSHVWLVMAPFGLLMRRKVPWGGMGEVYLASAMGMNFLLCYAVIVVFGYLSDRHLLAGVVVMMSWMAVGVFEVVRGLAEEGRVRRWAAFGAFILCGLIILMGTEDLRPRRTGRRGQSSAGSWIRRNMPGAEICGTMVPQVAVYANTEYYELQNVFPYYDVAQYARTQGAGVVVVSKSNVRYLYSDLVIPSTEALRLNTIFFSPLVVPIQLVYLDYPLQTILSNKGLRERFSCEEHWGDGVTNIVVFEVLPRRDNG